jgi:hypothetical protein
MESSEMAIRCFMQRGARLSLAWAENCEDWAEAEELHHRYVDAGWTHYQTRHRLRLTSPRVW